MKPKVTLMAQLADGLIQVRWDGVTSSPPIAVWGRGRARKEHTCVLTGARINRGALVYRPLGNQDYRYCRIAADLVDAVLELTDEQIDTILKREEN